VNSSERTKEQFWTQISVISLRKQTVEIPFQMSITIHVQVTVQLKVEML
jgi:hypothetical protein